MPVSRPRMVRFLFALCGGLLLFLGARWMFQQDNRERLRDLPRNGNELITIRNGMAYFRMKEVFQPRILAIKDSRGQAFPQMMPALEPFLLHVMPVTGGAARQIGEQRIPGAIFRRMQFTPKALFYFSYVEKAMRGLSWHLNVAGSPRQTRIGAGVADVKPYSMFFMNGAPVEMFRGRTFPVIISALDADPMCVVGDSVYWIDIDTSQQPASACASLKVIHRGQHEPRTIMSGLSPLSSLAVDVGDNRILWLIAPAVKEYSPGRRIFRIDSEENSPQPFLSNMDNQSVVSVPVSLNGRVYWKRDVYKIAEANYEDHAAEIMSSAPNGSDTRTEVKFETSSMPTQLYAHGGKLYFEVYEGKVNDRKRSGNVLMRLDPESPSQPQEVYKFPPKTSQFLLDGDYLYFTQDEERSQVTNGSNRGSFPVFTRVLNRRRLPH